MACTEPALLHQVAPQLLLADAAVPWVHVGRRLAKRISFEELCSFAAQVAICCEAAVARHLRGIQHNEAPAGADLCRVHHAI